MDHASKALHAFEKKYVTMVKVPMRLLGLFVTFAATTAFAGEYAVLASGARLHIDRHEADGAKVRLYYGSGFAELNSGAIRGFEEDGYIPPAASVIPETPA